jgi:hypothetical protein
MAGQRQTMRLLQMSAIWVLSGNVFAGTLTYPIVDTGQNVCYGNTTPITAPAANEAFYGQDAQYQDNQPAYAPGPDGLTVLDNVTGLTWTQSCDLTGDGVIDVDDKLTFADAQSYPAMLNTANFGGCTDWRLPNIKELYSLMLFSGADPSGYQGTDTSGLVPFIDTNVFDFAYGDTAAGERIIDAQFCSTTTYVSTVMFGSNAVFGLNLADGRIKGYDIVSPNGTTKKFYCLFVRGNSGYGVNAFIDNGDGTISDAATGLMWQQGDSEAGLNWQEALAYAEGLTLGGYDDWRLPNAKELQSIVDYSRSPDTTDSAAIDPRFTCSAIMAEDGLGDYPFYWTGTTHVKYTGMGDAAVYLAFGEALGWMEQPPMSGNYTLLDVHGAGAQRSDPKAGDPADYPYGHGPQGDVIRIDNYVRCVRSLQCGQPGYVSPVAGDLTDDCDVDLLDMVEMSGGWRTVYTMEDLTLIAQNWLCLH